MSFLRSCLFFVGFILITIVFGLVAPLTLLLPFKIRYFVMTRWAFLSILWLKVTCKLDYKVTGLDNIPNEAVMIVSNHQSTFETIVFQIIFPPFTWIMKRELLWLPFFGWGAMAFKPIQINRSKGVQALKYVFKQGIQRFNSGLSVLVFPEGTRVKVNEKKPYRTGGIALAKKAKVMILPVAHNAGLFWAKGQFIKKSGVVSIHIGQPIPTNTSDNVNELTEKAETWIKSTVKRLY